MKLLTITIPDSEKPLYLRIAGGIRQAIREGRVRAGEPLPSARKIADQLSCHRHTVMTALSELVAEGWVVSRKRQGYFVVETIPDHFFENAPPAEMDGFCNTFEWRLAVAPGKLPDPPGKDILYNFQSGIADYSLFPFKDFNACFSEALRSRDAEKFRYGNPLGEPEFLDAMHLYLRRARGISDKDIIVTNGSQEGVYISARLLLRPGDAVAVEDPGYPTAWEAFRSLGARIVPVRVDGAGMDPEHLQYQLRRHPLRLIYTTPLHQFPTTVTIPSTRRIMLYEIAVRNKIPILEDDYDHEYHYRCYPPSPLAAGDPCGQVIYTSTFSKMIFPSLRLGFMAVPHTLTPAIRYLRFVSTRQSNLIVQKAVARWVDSGGFERHLRKMRRIYEQRRNVMIECMQGAREDGLGISWYEPDGGMAIWLDTGKDTARVESLARSRGMYLLPESRFRLNRGRYTHFRLGFAHLTEEVIRKGMSAFFQVIQAV